MTVERMRKASRARLSCVFGFRKALIVCASFFVVLILYQFYWFNANLSSASNSVRYSLDSAVAKGSAKIAFAMKTGKETGVIRLPLQLLTYLKHFQNVFFFSDEDTQIGNIRVK